MDIKKIILNVLGILLTLKILVRGIYNLKILMDNESDFPEIGFLRAMEISAVVITVGILIVLVLNFWKKTAVFAVVGIILMKVWEIVPIIVLYASKYNSYWYFWVKIILDIVIMALLILLVVHKINYKIAAIACGILSLMGLVINYARSFNLLLESLNTVPVRIIFIINIFAQVLFLVILIILAEIDCKKCAQSKE